MNSACANEVVGLYTVTHSNHWQSEAVLSEKNASEYTVSTDDNDQYNDDPDTRCGLGSWTPRWLKVAANTKLLLFFYSIAGVTSEALFSYFVGCISTLEKRFAYDTKNSGLIMISDEIAPLIIGVFIGYFGGMGHRPRILAFGIFVGSISSFVMALPYFIYGSGNFDANLLRSASRISGVNAQFCDRDFNDLDGTCGTAKAIHSVLIFVAGNFLTGVSVCIYYSIGTSYLDDSIKKKDSPIYLSTIFVLRLFGPTLGFLLCSFCLHFYEDPFTDPGYGPSDPRWVGAWWLGFIILGIMMAIVSAPIMFFPKRFSKNKVPVSLDKTDKGAKRSLIMEFKDMGKAIKRLLKNPIMMFAIIGNAFRFKGNSGYYVLLPKYIEMQFKQSASKASLYTGPVSIVGMQIGILLGGFSIRKFKPRPRVLTGSFVFIEYFNLVVMGACMLITCPFHQMQEPSTVVNPLIHPGNECNADCMCTTKAYTPVCGPDGKSTYFSPCYAGCSDYNRTGEKEVFMNCKCVHNEEGGFMVGDANESYCGFECQWMITYVVILTLGRLVSSTREVGSRLVFLRCVDPEDKSIALGADSSIYSLLAFIPYPIIYGALTDASCLVWEESCGTTGNCWVYDINKFRYLLHGVTAGFIFLGCVFDIIVWYLSPRLRNLYEEDEDDKTGETVGKTESTSYSAM